MSADGRECALVQINLSTRRSGDEGYPFIASACLSPMSAAERDELCPIAEEREWERNHDSPPKSDTSVNDARYQDTGASAAISHSSSLPVSAAIVSGLVIWSSIPLSRLA
jgi:hypothetical protein